MKVLGFKVSNEVYEKVKSLGKPSDILRQALDQFMKNKEVNLSNNVVNQQIITHDINTIHKTLNGFKTLNSSFNDDNMDDDEDE